MIDAYIFDWDGVVVDSGDAHNRSWQLLAEEQNLLLPDNFFKISFGMKSDRIISEVLDWTHDFDKIIQFTLRKEELYREIIHREGIKEIHGTRNFLKLLKNKQAKCVIGSSTAKENIELAIKKLKLNDFFYAIISAEDVINGKPDPEVFIRCADRAGALYSNCVVIEDAVVGIKAAKSAGMKVVALTTTNTKEKLFEADLILDSLEDFDGEI